MTLGRALVRGSRGWLPEAPAMTHQERREVLWPDELGAQQVGVTDLKLEAVQLIEELTTPEQQCGKQIATGPNGKLLHPADERCSIELFDFAKWVRRVEPA